MSAFFERLFPEKMRGVFRFNSEKSSRNQELETRNSDPNTQMVYHAASCQSSGRERVHNEDTLFVLNSAIDGLNAPVSFGLYLVADGMGGHQSGEVASSLAVQATSQYLMENVFSNFVFEQQSFSENEITKFLKNAVDEAQKLVSRRVPGGGTTLTLVMVLGEQCFYAHVGDCRLYFIDFEGNLTLKTRDHSLVKRLIDLGEISENEASSHPQRNVLYRALGQSDPFEPDIGQFSLSKGERIMICSDGLWGVLEESQISTILKKKNEIEQAACALVKAANESGGPDNISLILVKRLV